ncbi:sigma 54-interacting transcriptional regulator [Rhodopirellula sp. JC639]|uniref:sigma 54-interacting transcriptional regulator n=1 Tax=Stieleria mannarensis TaxID=2755585 RepID=UPI0016013826|nr:sigma 54-interacting transcriptional regulator [Rhodopirellula sp. JC639]
MKSALSLGRHDGRADDPSDWDFRQVFDRSPVGVYVVQAGRICYANPVMGQLLDRAPDAITGESVSSFIRRNDQSDLESLRWQTGESESSCFRARLVRADGHSATVEVMESPLDVGSAANDRDDAAWVGVMVDLTAHRRADLEIQERLNFEQLLANLSAGFVNLPCDQIDSRIDASLKSLVEFLGNDRSSFIEFGDDADHVIVSHSYAAGDCRPFPIGPFAVDRLPWYINQFRSGNTVFLRSIPQDLPESAEKERAHCLREGIRSNVAIPIKVGGKRLGALTFAFIRKPCDWSREILSRLGLIGEVFGNALVRRRNEQMLQAALSENVRLRRQLEQENLYLREHAVVKHRHGRIIGHSDAITRVLADVERVATTDAPVLLTGETGTGKELLAQTIHALSARKDRPMTVVNCASLPATLIESELFGRAAGAYTGAASAAIGRFELADGSTLFLDEIGELPLELQAKLLRVLQDGRFERLGTAKTISVDVRIIAATNRDLEAATRKNLFRSDLFYRLNVFPIHVPPLRDRRDDIPPLTWAFVEAFGRRMGKSIKTIPRRTMKQLQNHDWPGNIRELSNAIERAMILADSDTLHIETPATAREGAETQKTLREVERDQILRVLEKTGWRIRGSGGAAERLDIKPTTLEARMAKLGIRRPSQG